ncbi:MAG TPA: extracellular solute-binding protein, partial [Rectinemataceae bacterium]|nr:extracellular solute-binding protein [Rectinemataceae bacterium]
MRKIVGLALVGLIAAAALGAQTINVLLWDDPYPKALQAMLPEFEKATGIKVNIEMLQPPQVLTKTSVAVGKTSSDYDLVAMDEGNVPLFANLMVPYEAWPAGKKYPKVGKETVTPAMLDVGMWDGKLIGLPINGNLYVWMTRKDLVENPQYRKDFKAKYNYELGVPKTFKQMLEMGSFFNERGIAAGFGPF